MDHGPWQNCVKDGIGVDTISRFVSKRLKKVVETGDVNRIKTLKYILTLMEWKKCFKYLRKEVMKVPSNSEIRHQKAMEGTRPEVLDKIRNRFAPNLQVSPAFTSSKLTITALSRHGISKTY